MDRLKDEFLANTSHELRTPLNGIIGIAESVLHGAAGNVNTQLRKNLALIVSSGKRLTNLINDILDFSKLRNHDIRLQLKAIDLYPIVDVVLAVSRPLIARRPIELINAVPDDLPPVRADENRLQQILHNLIGNAVKFTEQGRIAVRA